MSPKSLIFLVLVGLCAAQVASADSPPTPSSTHLARLRHERGVKELLLAAKTKLEKILAMAKDAASSSLEVVWDYVYDLEAQVLDAGTEQLFSYGIEVNLTTVSTLMKSNIKGCATDEKIIAKAKLILNELLECVSQDAESLKALIENMKKLWETAQTMPATMAAVSEKCSAHDDKNDEPVADLNDLKLDAASHDLAVKANELLEEASKTMTKRELWSFSRMTRCVQSVYSLSKSDMVSIPGQIIAASANGYRVYQAAQGGIQSCVSLKASKNIPTIASLAVDLGVCVANMDIDELVATYPSLAGLKQLMDLAEKYKTIAADPKAAAASMLSSSVPGLPAGIVLPPGARQALAATANKL